MDTIFLGVVLCSSDSKTNSIRVSSSIGFCVSGVRARLDIAFVSARYNFVFAFCDLN